jgi:hypothetical protein
MSLATALLAAAIVMAEVGDVSTTVAMQQRYGSHELNPLMALLVDHLGVLSWAPMKVAFGVAIAAMIVRSPRLALPVACVCLAALPVVINGLQLVFSPL